MRKMERALPPPMLREKLPRFLQKCAQEFQDDLRYRDDPCYLRVWIQLVLTSPIAATSSCLDPVPSLVPDVNYAPGWCGSGRVAEAEPREGAAAEARAVHEEIHADVSPLFLAAGNRDVALVRALLANHKGY